MEYLDMAIKLVVGLSIMNVWLLRSKKSTPFRGGDAENLSEEFSAYGLPRWFMIILGTVKVFLSLMLIVSIWISELESIAAFGIAALMLGAVGMHLKIGDPVKKAFPAFLFLILSLAVTLI